MPINPAIREAEQAMHDWFDSLPDGERPGTKTSSVFDAFVAGYTIANAKNLPDDPEWDSTDFAHPAWWRGNDRGFRAGMEIVEKAMAEDPVGVLADKHGNEVVGRVAKLRRDLEATKGIPVDLRPIYQLARLWVAGKKVEKDELTAALQRVVWHFEETR